MNNAVHFFSVGCLLLLLAACNREADTDRKNRSVYDLQQADAYQTEIDVNELLRHIPDSWKKDIDRPYLLVQHYPLLRADHVRWHLEAMQSDYAGAMADSIYRMYIYQSDRYYKMQFDGGETAVLVDRAGTDIFPTWYGGTTALIHLPDQRIVNRAHQLLNPYHLLDWLESTTKKPDQDLASKVRDSSWSQKRDERHILRISSTVDAFRDSLASLVPVYDLPHDSLGGLLPYVMMEPDGVVVLPDVSGKAVKASSISNVGEQFMAVSNRSDHKFMLFEYPSLKLNRVFSEGYTIDGVSSPGQILEHDGHILVWDEMNKRIASLDERLYPQGFFTLGTSRAAGMGWAPRREGIVQLVGITNDEGLRKTWFVTQDSARAQVKQRDGIVYLSSAYQMQLSPSLTGNGRFFVVYAGSEPYLWIYDDALELVAGIRMTGEYAQKLMQGEGAQSRNPLYHFFQDVWIDQHNILQAKTDAGTLLAIDLASLKNGSPDWFRIHFRAGELLPSRLRVAGREELVAFSHARTVQNHTLLFSAGDNQLLRYPAVRNVFPGSW